MSLYLLKRPFDREKAAAEYKVSLPLPPPPAETMVQRGKKWVLTAAAYASLDLGNNYDYGGNGNGGRRNGKGHNGEKVDGMKGAGK